MPVWHRWKALSSIERWLFAVGWSIAAASTCAFTLWVSNEYWVEHTFLLNIASALTASAFGLPVAVAVVRRIGERSAMHAVSLNAAATALRDAQQVRRISSELWNGEDLEALRFEILRHWEAVPDDVPSGGFNLDYEARRSYVRGPGMDARAFAERMLRARPPNDDDLAHLQNLSRSLTRLRDEPELRARGRLWDPLPESWSYVSDFRQAATELTATLDQSVTDAYG